MPQAVGARSSSGRRTTGTAVSPAVLEAALLAALDSPAVAARLSALAEHAIAEALATALANKTGAAGALLGEGGSTPPSQPAASRPKVLVVGLTAEQAQTLVARAGQVADLRFWRPGETREQLQSVARACQVIVLMSEAVDPDVDVFLQSLPVRLIRHGGSVARLRDRLLEIGERGFD